MQITFFVVGWLLTVLGLALTGLNLFTALSPEFSELGGTQTEFIRELIVSIAITLVGSVIIVLSRNKLNSTQGNFPNHH